MTGCGYGRILGFGLSAAGLLRLILQQIEDGLVEDAFASLPDGDEEQIEFAKALMAYAVVALWNRDRWTAEQQGKGALHIVLDGDVHIVERELVGHASVVQKKLLTQVSLVASGTQVVRGEALRRRSCKRARTIPVKSHHATSTFRVRPRLGAHEKMSATGFRD